MAALNAMDRRSARSLPTVARLKNKGYSARSAEPSSTLADRRRPAAGTDFEANPLPFRRSKSGEGQ